MERMTTKTRKGRASLGGGQSYIGGGGGGKNRVERGREAEEKGVWVRDGRGGRWGIW